ncbi:MAG: GNAT family N-acetyltransferase [Candidatus Hermodarchaeota archaeon]
MFNYREAKSSDAKGIAELLVDTWRSTYSAILSKKVLQKRNYKIVEERWKPRINNLSKKDLMDIAEKEDEIVGIVWVRTEKSNPVNDLVNAEKFNGELMAIYVLKNYQRMGVGTKLVRFGVEFLLKNKIHSMIVWVFKDNSAKQFYINLGATYIGDSYKDLDGEKYLESAYGWENIEIIFNKTEF